MKKSSLILAASTFFLSVGAALITSGCQKVDIVDEPATPPQVDPTAQQAIKQAIEKYTKTPKSFSTHLGSSTIDGKRFCSYKLLGIDKITPTFNAYVWTFCGEYNLRNAKLQSGAAASFPVALMLQKQGDSYEVTNHKIPGDGGLYAEDIQKIFPRYVLESPEFTANQGASLQRETITKAKAYFKVNSVELP